MKRLSQRHAELRAAGRRAYYDGISRNPHHLRAGILWREGWRSAQREVDEFIERQVERNRGA